MSVVVRECSLRREFATLYPGIEPDTWEVAANIAERVQTRRTWSEGATESQRARVLDDAHFTFRGGRNAGRGPVRTRHADARVGEARAGD